MIYQWWIMTLNPIMTENVANCLQVFSVFLEWTILLKELVLALRRLLLLIWCFECFNVTFSTEMMMLPSLFHFVKSNGARCHFGCKISNAIPGKVFSKFANCIICNLAAWLSVSPTAPWTIKNQNYSTTNTVLARRRRQQEIKQSTEISIEQ